MEYSALVGRQLLSLRMRNVGTHPAWVDASTPQIATYAANLELADSYCVQVRPCEVSIPNQYPALGIEMLDWLDSPEIQRGVDGHAFDVTTPEEVKPLLPAIISAVRAWDSMGEGPISAVDLTLSTGVTLTLRHVFPPMMLGLDIHTRAP